MSPGAATCLPWTGDFCPLGMCPDLQMVLMTGPPQREEGSRED